MNYISQPVSNGYAWTPGTSLILLPLIVLTYGYLGVITVDMTEPLAEKRIETIDQLFNGRQYKFAAPDEPTMDYYYRNFLKPVKPNFIMEPDMYQIIDKMTFQYFMKNPFEAISILAK